MTGYGNERIRSKNRAIKLAQNEDINDWKKQF